MYLCRWGQVAQLPFVGQNGKTADMIQKISNRMALAFNPHRSKEVLKLP